MSDRSQKLRRQLKQEGLDALLVTNFKNVTYLTGFTGDDSYLLKVVQGLLTVAGEVQSVTGGTHA